MKGGPGEKGSAGEPGRPGSRGLPGKMVSHCYCVQVGRALVSIPGWTTQTRLAYSELVLVPAAVFIAPAGIFHSYQAGLFSVPPGIFSNYSQYQLE